MSSARPGGAAGRPCSAHGKAAHVSAGRATPGASRDSSAGGGPSTLPRGYAPDRTIIVGEPRLSTGSALSVARSSQPVSLCPQLGRLCTDLHTSSACFAAISRPKGRSHDSAETTDRRDGRRRHDVRRRVVHEGRPGLDAVADGLERVDIGHTDSDGHCNSYTDAYANEVGFGAHRGSSPAASADAMVRKYYVDHRRSGQLHPLRKKPVEIADRLPCGTEYKHSRGIIAGLRAEGSIRPVAQLRPRAQSKRTDRPGRTNRYPSRGPYWTLSRHESDRPSRRRGQVALSLPKRPTRNPSHLRVVNRAWPARTGWRVERSWTEPRSAEASAAHRTRSQLFRCDVGAGAEVRQRCTNDGIVCGESLAYQCIPKARFRRSMQTTSRRTSATVRPSHASITNSQHRLARFPAARALAPGGTPNSVTPKHVRQQR